MHEVFHVLGSVGESTGWRVHDGGEGGTRRTADLLRRRVGRDERRELLLETLQLPDERVVVGVADLGIVELVVALVVVADEGSELVDPGCDRRVGTGVGIDGASGVVRHLVDVSQGVRDRCRLLMSQDLLTSKTIGTAPQAPIDRRVATACARTRSASSEVRRNTRSACSTL